MRPKIKSAKRKASKLHGATATFVSLVDRGANETPFKMIKTAEGVGAVGIAKRSKVAASHKSIKSGKKSVTPETKKTVMAKMVFDQDHFEDEAEVRAWIEKAEWETTGIDVVDTGEGFYEARPTGTTDETFTRLSKVDTDEEGVTAIVGEMIVKAEGDDEDEDATDEADEDEAEGDDEDEDGDEPVSEAKAEDEAEDEPAKAKAKPAKKAAAPVKLSKRAQFIAKAKDKVVKFDSWDARFSGANTLAKALKAGMEWDGVPPGFFDVQSAFNGVVAAIVGDEGLVDGGKQEALNKASLEYAEVIGGLDTFFDTYVTDADTVMKKFTDDKAQEQLVKWADDFAVFASGETETPAVETKAVVKKAADPATIDYSKVADLVSKAVADLAERVEGVSETVTKMASRRQVKKSGDTTDVEGRAPVKKTDKQETADWAERTRKRAMFG